MNYSGHIKFIIFSAVAVIILSGCKTSRTHNAKYEAAWQEIVQSEAWRSSLDDEQSDDMYADGNESEDQWITGNDRNVEAKDPFEIQFNSWVSQAYLKIIEEAESADNEIKAEYDRFIAENPDAAASTDENVVKMMQLYKRKYESHKAMLDGLKSWNAFESYGSDDLKFFKEENRKVVKGMYRNGRQEEKIVDFLVYKLADLYHLD